MNATEILRVMHYPDVWKDKNMKILNITISEFAGLGQRSYNLSEGLNIIEGLNESGKSSLLAFIKFILYGFVRRGAGEELGERERYVSWTGKRAAGSMMLVSGGKKWRVERELFVQTRGTRESVVDDVKIIDVETGAHEHSGEVPGMLFLGIPAEVFSSSCGISQSSLAAINTAEVGSSIENLLFSADESLNTQKATDKLESIRRQLLHKNEKTGKIVDMRSERNILRNRLSMSSTAAKNIIAKEAMAGEYKRQADEARKLLEELETIWEVSEATLTLGKFDELRSLEKKRAGYAGSLSELKNDSFTDGFIADRQYAAKLAALSRDLTAAESEFSRAEAELIKLENAVPYDPERAKTAEYLVQNASGSTDSVLRVYRSLNKSVRLPKVTGISLIVLGGLSAASGAALILLNFMIPGLIASAAGVLIAAGGILSILNSRKKRRKLNEYLAKLNFASDPGEAGLAAYIDRCFAAAETEKQYSGLLEARRGVVTVRRDKLTALRSECRAELAKTGTDESDENLITALSGAAEFATTFCTACERLSMLIENTDREITALRDYLFKFDEPLLRRKAEGIPETGPITSEEYRRRRLELMSAVKNADDKQHSTENELAALGAATENPRRLSLQLDQYETQLAEMQLKYDAVKLASESLAEAAEELRRGVTPLLKTKAGELMGKLTEGRYTDLGVGQEMAVTVNAGGITRPLAAMSGGTRDAAYISLRIALASLFCRHEIPPLLIDEGLSQLDDVRAGNFISVLIEWCENDGGQCLIFTCHSREAKLSGGKANHIIL